MGPRFPWSKYGSFVFWPLLHSAALLHVTLGSPPGPLDTHPHLLHVLRGSQFLSFSAPSYLLETFCAIPATVSLHCSVPGTLLSQSPLASHSPNHPYCLPHSASSLHHCQQRGLPVTEAESSRSRPCHPRPVLCCLSLLVFL